MASRIFLVKEPNDCEVINKLCEKLDNKGVDYEIEYDDELSDNNCFGYTVVVDW